MRRVVDSIARLQEDLFRDANGVVRSTRRCPGLLAAIIVTLMLVIGGNTAIFSFVRVLLFEELSVREPKRLAIVAVKGYGLNSAFTYRFYREIASRSQTFEGVAARSDRSVNLSYGDVAARVRAEIVSANYFSVLGTYPALGRLFKGGSDDETISDPHLCIISFRFWREQFSGNPDILGRVIRLNGLPFRVIGVTEPKFSGSEVGNSYDLQIPISAAPLLGISLEKTTWLRLMGRLKRGVSKAEAETEIRVVGKEVDQETFPRRENEYVLEDGSRGFGRARARLESTAIILLSGAGLLLLIACANIGGLLSARGIDRQYEMAVRLSLGASRGRLVRQLLVESAVLALFAGACSLLFAQWLVKALTTLLNDGKPASVVTVPLDSFVLGVTAAVSLLAAVLFGLVPALHTSHTDPSAALRQGGFFQAGRFGSARRLLVAAQVALSLILLCGAGVLAQSLRNLRTVDFGSHPEQVVLLTVDPQRNGYSSEAARIFYKRLVEDASRIPGIESATLCFASVLSGSYSISEVRVPGFTGSYNDAHYQNFVGPGYFRTLGMAILRGREFDNHDNETGPRVAIINQRVASRYWPNEDPIGKHIRMGSDLEIVGVVQNSIYRSIREEPPLTIYVPVWQQMANESPSLALTLQARVRGNVGRAMGLLREKVRELDQNLPIEEMRTLATQRDYGISTERTMAFLSALFSVLASTIAMTGVGGLIAFGIASRTTEIGVRMAFGASRFSIMGIFLRETSLLLAAGAVIGSPFAWAASAFLKPFVYKMPAQDAKTLAMAAVFVVGAGFGAAVIPLTRATRIQPAVALRQE